MQPIISITVAEKPEVLYKGALFFFYYVLNINIGVMLHIYSPPIYLNLTFLS